MQIGQSYYGKNASLTKIPPYKCMTEYEFCIMAVFGPK